jgi:hypothetical protein
MKKSQRLRLAALLAKEKSALTTDESAELATLQALADTHTDPAKDVDDTASLTAATTATTVAPKHSDFRTVLAGAFAAFRDKVAVGSELAAAQTQVTKLTADLATAQTQLAATTAQLGEICSFFGVDASAILVGKSDGAAALITKKIGDLAAEQVACLGFPAASLPKPTSNESGHDYAELIRSYSEIKNPQERAAFYAKNIAPLAGRN